MAGELDAARRIQMGLLPDPARPAQGPPLRRSPTLLEPARTVGGDFFDCFMVDARSLFFVVADVSGKGLPAALFMAAVQVAPSRARRCAAATVGDVLTARAGGDRAREPGAAVRHRVRRPRSTCRPACWSSPTPGTSRRSCAPPAARRERLGTPGGPPLCVVEELRVPDATGASSRRATGSCVMTDGVTEAMNPKRAVLRRRAAAHVALVDARRGASAGRPGTAPARGRGRFAAARSAADDITLLALRWEGPGRRRGRSRRLADVDLDAAVARLGDVVLGRHQQLALAAARRPRCARRDAQAHQHARAGARRARATAGRCTRARRPCRCGRSPGCRAAAGACSSPNTLSSSALAIRR